MTGHRPVLLEETVARLNLSINDNVIDATLGGGGQAVAILKATGPNGRLLGLEADPRTLVATNETMREFGHRFVGANANFRDLKAVAAEKGFTNIAAIVFDLGLSSIALADADRGLSFQTPGPLDMRLDPAHQTLTAAAIVNHWPHAELRDIFRRLGQEPQAVRITDAIIAARQRQLLTDTIELASIIERVKKRHGRIHPATLVFQSLRMAVNDELGCLYAALPSALELLRPGGRLAVITFHSLEDRLVKNWIKQTTASGGLQRVNKQVIRPTRAETLANPRARSAKLRVIEKI